MMGAIELDARPGSWWVSLNRPPLNVLDIASIRELHRTLAPLADRRDVKVLVLRSALPRVFSAGVDVRDHTRDRVGEMLESFHAVFRLLDRLPQATVAAVDGTCLGGGCELAAFCDVVLATPSSTFGQPEINLGCFPPVAAVVFPRLIGRAAFDMILTGQAVSAAEAVRVGLITHVVGDLPVETERMVSSLAHKSGAVLGLARRALRGEWFDRELSRVEALYRHELLRTLDMDEGIQAFLEKRSPDWKDA
jgi:cyclohexa-1,5-dienecarbonyl-CoA hydratase